VKTLNLEIRSGIPSPGGSGKIVVVDRRELTRYIRQQLGLIQLGKAGRAEAIKPALIAKWPSLNQAYR